jgi:thiol-disulfide isomerase/thioredoxin
MQFTSKSILAASSLTVAFYAAFVASGSAALASAPTTRPIIGVLWDSEGRPVAGATVVCVTDGCAEDVTDGKVTMDGDVRQTTTDDLGRFVFGPSTRPVGSTFAVTPQGRAWAAAGDVDPQRPMRIKPFSYVEGILRVRGHVAAGAKVKAWCWPTDGGSADAPDGMFSFSMTADDQGRFRVPVLGGEESVIGRVDAINFDGDVPRLVYPVVPPATTIRQDLGGGGRFVSFTVRPPDGFTLRSARVYLVPDVPKINLASPEWPVDSVHWEKPRQDAFYKAWADSDAGNAALVSNAAAFRARDAQYYYGSCQSDGSMRLEDVLPGKYWITVDGSGVASSGQKRELISRQQAMVSLPPQGREDDAQSWAEVRLTLSRRLYAGDAAPPFDTAGLDGGRVQLSDFHGKFVLVHFWASWCGPCRQVTPDLKAIDDRFGTDPRFVSIHVAEDDAREAAQRYVAAEVLRGIEAWSGPAEASEAAKAYGATAVPTMVLISPDGKVLLTTHSSGELMPAISKLLTDQH